MLTLCVVKMREDGICFEYTISVCTHSVKPWNQDQARGRGVGWGWGWGGYKMIASVRPFCYM